MVDTKKIHFFYVKYLQYIANDFYKFMILLCSHITYLILNNILRCADNTHCMNNNIYTVKLLKIGIHKLGKCRKVETAILGKVLKLGTVCRHLLAGDKITKCPVPNRVH